MSTKIRPVVTVFSRVVGLTSYLRQQNPPFDITEVIPLDKSSTSPLPEDSVSQLKNARVLLADPGLLRAHGLVQDLPALEWMQATWAGVDAMMQVLDKNKPLPQYTLTRFGGAMGTSMAEYVMGYIIALERGFNTAKNLQEQRTWDQDALYPYRLMAELTLGVVGLGDIGKEIARVAKSFGMRVIGLVNRDIPQEKRSPHVDKYFRPLSQLPDLLIESDYVVNVLPSTPQTKGVFNGEVFKHCAHKKSVFVNVGRGDAVDETSILTALNEGWLSHAVLDVFPVEPLPRESPLWCHAAVTITPHIATVSPANQVVDLFLKNYEKFTSGASLDYQVNWETGY